MNIHCVGVVGAGEGFVNMFKVSQVVSAAFAFWPRALRLAFAGPAIQVGGALSIAAGGFSGQTPLIWVGLMLQLAGGVIGTSGFLRLALADAGITPSGRQLGPAGLQWGAPEWRILSVALLLMLTCFAAGFAAGLVVGLPIGFVGGLTHNSSITSLSAVAGGLVGFFAGCYVAARLATAAPATIAEGRIVFLRAWRTTKGQGWKVLGAFVCAALPYIVGAMVLAMVGSAVMLSISLSEAQIQLVNQTTGAIAYSLLALAPLIGLQAELYKILSVPAPSDPPA